MTQVVVLTGPSQYDVAQVLSGTGGLGWFLIDLSSLSDLYEQTLPDDRPTVLVTEHMRREAEDLTVLAAVAREMYGAASWFCVAEGDGPSIVLAAGFDAAHEVMKGVAGRTAPAPHAEEVFFGAKTWKRAVEKALQNLALEHSDYWEDEQTEAVTHA